MDRWNRKFHFDFLLWRKTLKRDVVRIVRSRRQKCVNILWLQAVFNQVRNERLQGTSLEKNLDYKETKNLTIKHICFWKSICFKNISFIWNLESKQKIKKHLAFSLFNALKFYTYSNRTLLGFAPSAERQKKYNKWLKQLDRFGRN